MSNIHTFRWRRMTVALLALVLVPACDEKSPPAGATTPNTAAPPAPAPQRALTDDQIESAVERGIARDRAVSAFSVGVHVATGVVTLTGNVDTLAARQRALAVAMAVRGVRSVVNRIQIQPAEEISDKKLEGQVKYALLNDPTTDSYEIDVAAKSGVVTLSGKVDSWAEKDLARLVAAQVPGVIQIEDDTTIAWREERSDAEIKNDVMGRLRWDALVDAALTEVSVNDGVVELSGKVGSLAERQRAYTDAWVQGVENVQMAELSVDPEAADDALRGHVWSSNSDEEIQQAIEDAAFYDPRVSSFKITSRVDDGKVTLTGTVDNLKAKYAAARLAENTVGTISVDNQLVVKPKRSVSDSALERAVRDALIFDPLTKAYQVQIDAQDGVVTLSGKVDYFVQKARAEDLASSRSGTLGVVNQIDVKQPDFAYVYDPYAAPSYPLVATWEIYVPKVAKQSDARIANEIEDELFWSPFVDLDEVRVSVSQGTATLTGKVDTWTERRAATENAFEGGAVAVDNQLAVE